MNLPSRTTILFEFFVLCRSLIHFFIFDKVFDGLILGGTGKIIAYTQKFFSLLIDNEEPIEDIKTLDPIEEDVNIPDRIYNYLIELILPIEFQRLLIGTLSGIFLYQLTKLPSHAGSSFKVIYNNAEKMPVAILNLVETIITYTATKCGVINQNNDIITTFISHDFASNSFIGSLYTKFFEKYHGPMEFFYHLAVLISPIAQQNGIDINEISFNEFYFNSTFPESEIC